MNREECQNTTREHIDNVKKLLDLIIIDLIKRGEIHDKSKLEEPELTIFMEYTSKLAGSTYGSDEYKQFLKEMEPALNHHYDNNKHHPEHFFRKYNSGFTGMTGLHEMTLIDLIEMLIDWKAATLRHNNGDILKSIEQNQKRFGYGDELKNIFINTIKGLKLETNGTKTP